MVEEKADDADKKKEGDKEKSDAGKDKPAAASAGDEQGRYCKRNCEL